MKKIEYTLDKADNVLWTHDEMAWYTAKTHGPKFCLFDARLLWKIENNKTNYLEGCVLMKNHQQVSSPARVYRHVGSSWDYSSRCHDITVDYGCSIDCPYLASIKEIYPMLNGEE